MILPQAENQFVLRLCPLLSTITDKAQILGANIPTQVQTEGTEVCTLHTGPLFATKLADTEPILLQANRAKMTSN